MIDKTRITSWHSFWHWEMNYMPFYISIIFQKLHAYNIDKQFIITHLFVWSVKEIVPFWNPKDFRYHASSPSLPLFKAHIYICLYPFICQFINSLIHSFVKFWFIHPEYQMLH